MTARPGIRHVIIGGGGQLIISKKLSDRKLALDSSQLLVYIYYVYQFMVPILLQDHSRYPLVICHSLLLKMAHSGFTELTIKKRWKITMFNGKIHELNGDFPVRFLLTFTRPGILSFRPQKPVDHGHWQCNASISHATHAPGSYHITTLYIPTMVNLWESTTTTTIVIFCWLVIF